MKKISLLIFCLSIFSLSAQNWAPAGAVWNYKIQRVYPHLDGVITDSLIGEETISGKQCKKIVGTFEGVDVWNNNLSSNTLTVNNYRTFYSVEENNVLFLFNPSTQTFDTVVNWNAAIGDKWLRLNSPSPYEGCNNFRKEHTVTDTGRVSINGFNLKKIVTEYVSTHVYSQNTITVMQTFTFVERISTTNSFMFPFICEENNTIYHNPGFGTFQCYKDNSFPQYSLPTVSSCNYVTGLNEIAAESIKIYPNPANSKVIIDCSEPAEIKIKIFDVAGKQISVIPSYLEENIGIDVSDLENGIYFLNIIKRGAWVKTEKLIKN